MKPYFVLIVMSLATTPHFAYSSIAAPAPTVPTSQPGEEKLEPYITVAEFRGKNPKPEDLDSVVLAFQKASQFILEKGKQGYSADVTFIYQDKSIFIGKDYIFTGVNPKIQEIRPYDESIAANGSHCKREYMKDWVCSKLDLSTIVLALKPIIPEAVFKLESGVQICASGECSVYRITQAYTGLDSKNNLTINSNFFNNRYVTYSLFLDSADIPMMFTETVAHSGLTATYLFDFKTPVADFELPVNP